MKHWSGETWLDITKLELLKQPMHARFKLAKDKGCQGLEPDNVDCYAHGANCVSGKSVGELKSYQLAYNKWQTEAAHSLGLAIGLKNALGLVSDLVLGGEGRGGEGGRRLIQPYYSMAIVSYYDFAVNESCPRFDECYYLKPFSDQGKAIFGTSYSPTSREK
eukprot:Pgem_evm1s13451